MHKLTRPGQDEPFTVDGRTHYWHSNPGFSDTEDLLVVRVIIAPGEGHPFHYHPNKEEVIYFISGTAEQWVAGEKQIMGPGSSVYVPKSAIHATYNRSEEPLEFIAIITPVSAEGPVTVELGEEAGPHGQGWEGMS